MLDLNDVEHARAYLRNCIESGIVTLGDETIWELSDDAIFGYAVTLFMDMDPRTRDDSRVLQ